MTPSQLKKAVEDNRKRIPINSRAELTNMIWLVEDLLEAEIKYLEEYEPSATTTINETKIAREAVRDLYSKVDGMDTNDLVKERIWN